MGMIFDSHEKQIEPSDYFIAYIDILGYKNLIKKPGVIELARIINKHIIYARQIAKTYFSEKDIGSEIKLKAFSDNILLCTKTNWEILLAMVVSLQCKIIQEDGVFIRGVLCHGNLYFDDEFLCGQGILLAHEIESEIAIYPRIIYHKSYFYAANQQDKMRKATNDFEFVSHLPHAFVDFDSYSVLDYLLIGCHLIKDEEEKRNLLKRHKDIIIKNLQADLPERVMQKYQWSMNYHDHCIETLISSGAPLSDDYFIKKG